ncbi:hypothetical protein HPB47_026598 [Ixodes persulcatus]|uniref:Uncharacterized protein n=1 Tax=Ixodes persulcatus TaxID=34615 RepID=A0AC60PYD7_IXOPE|nr:hypothetical protein HPB47_026598 [Ixodes persulcatus]
MTARMRQRRSDWMAGPQIHCDSRGNYEELQCEGELCYCADPMTGKPTGNLVLIQQIALLPCFGDPRTGHRTHGMGTAGRPFRMPGFRHALVAFHRASAALARSRLTGRRSVIEDRKLASEAGELHDLLAVLITPATIAICTRSFSERRPEDYCKN